VIAARAGEVSAKSPDAYSLRGMDGKGSGSWERGSSGFVTTRAVVIRELGTAVSDGGGNGGTCAASSGGVIACHVSPSAERADTRGVPVHRFGALRVGRFRCVQDGYNGGSHRSLACRLM